MDRETRRYIDHFKTLPLSDLMIQSSEITQDRFRHPYLKPLIPNLEDLHREVLSQTLPSAVDHLISLAETDYGSPRNKPRSFIPIASRIINLLMLLDGRKIPTDAGLLIVIEELEKLTKTQRPFRGRAGVNYHSLFGQALGELHYRSASSQEAIYRIYEAEISRIMNDYQRLAGEVSALSGAYFLRGFNYVHVQRSLWDKEGLKKTFSRN